MRGAEIGITRVWLKEDSDAYHVHPDCYADFKAAWMKGEAFFVGKDTYGDELVIKLGSVTAISRATPEAMKQAYEDAEADRKARALDGDD